MNDLVSIVVPVYKVEDVVINTLKSINDQKYKNIELVLVDDGSPDRSAIIAEEYLATTELNWRIIHKENGGLAAARNTGIENATGEWVICPDGDDYIEPWAIAEMIHFAQQTQLDCVFCGYKSVTLETIAVSKELQANGKVYDAEKMRHLFLERRLKLLVTGMLVRKEVYSRIKYNPECPYDEDIHFLWQLLFLYDKFGYISNEYYHYLNRSTSMVHTLSAESYLKTSQCYAELVKGLGEAYPSQLRLINQIYPKYRLGGAHVLAKANSYDVFRKAIVQDGYRREMSRLILQPNIKLALYPALYCCSLRLFYFVSR